MTKRRNSKTSIKDQKKRSGNQKKPRNKKKYWKHGVDVSEVDQHLDYEAETQRLVGEIKSKKDEELFIIQKTPSDVNVEPEVKQKQQISPHDLLGGLKCYQILENKGGHPAFKGGPKWRSKERVTKSTRKLRSYTGDLIENKETHDFVDLWREEPQKTPLSPDLEDYYMRQTKKKVANIPRTKLQKVTTLDKVEPPHPGSSYNPAYEDHQELLSLCVVEEESKIAKEEALEARLRIPPGTQPADEESTLREMAEGLFRDDTKLEIKEEPTDLEEIDLKNEEYTAPTAPVSAERRKRRAQRAREEKMKREKEKRENEKLEKRRMNDLYRLKSVKSSLKEEEAKIDQRVARRRERKAAKLGGAAKLSRQTFEEPEKDVNLSEELGGSLRLLKAEGSILYDRFKSLQKRNVIEVGTKQKKKRKYSLKTYTKKTHKESVQ